MFRADIQATKSPNFFLLCGWRLRAPFIVYRIAANAGFAKQARFSNDAQTALTCTCGEQLLNSICGLSLQKFTNKTILLNS
jgi:hypothetical protein